MTPAALEAFNISTYLQKRGLSVAQIQTELGLLANALYVQCAVLSWLYVDSYGTFVQGLLPQSALH